MSDRGVENFLFGLGGLFFCGAWFTFAMVTP